jgi:hypothetical protein
MKKIIGYAVVGLAGYIIGFYEMKYKTMKSLLQVSIEKQKDSTGEEQKEES